MAVEIVWEPKGVWRKFSGTLTGEDLLRAVALVHGDWRFDTLLYSLNDLRAVENVALDRHAIEQAAAESIGAMSTNRALVMAMVATRPDVLEAVKLFVSPPLNSFPAEYFDTIEGARAWLRSVFPGITMPGAEANGTPPDPPPSA